MTSRLLAIQLVAGLISVSFAVPASAITADEAVQRAVAAVESESSLADHDMIRLAIQQEETTSDGKTESSNLTALIHGDRLQNIRMELMSARRMFHEHGFQIIDVTNKPIEEIASEILATRTESLRKSGGRRRGTS